MLNLLWVLETPHHGFDGTADTTAEFVFPTGEMRTLSFGTHDLEWIT